MKFFKTAVTKINMAKFQFCFFIVSTIFLIFILSFGWGYMTGKFKYYPYFKIDEMVKSVKAGIQLYKLEVATHRSAHEIADNRSDGGVTINKLQLGDDPYIFMTLYREGAFMAQIIDRDGGIVHEWKIPYKKLNLLRAEDTKIQLSEKNVTLHGAFLTNNGDLYLVIEYGALIKLNRHSDLLWAIHLPINHDVDVDSNGTVWTLSRKLVKRGERWIPLAMKPYFEDQVLKISSDGKVLEQFSLLDIILENQYEGILYGGPPGMPRISHNDPLHANDVNVLTTEQAAYFPGVKGGDIMVSMRTISTIFVFNPETKKIKWCMTGPFHRQHSPVVSSVGTLLVFDNRTTRGRLGGNIKYTRTPQALGYSRLLSIDPVTRDILWQYQGTEASPFYTSIQGKLAEMRNGNILAVETEGGRVFEVDKQRGTIVWEFVNLVEKGYVGRVTQAFPLSDEQLDFLSPK